MPSGARYDFEVHNKVIALISPLAALARRTCPLHFCATAPEKPPIKQYGKNIKNVKVNGKYAIIMGNEGNGVRENIKNLSDEKLYIKMNNDCESLNVGVATSIILYEFS